MRQTSWLPRSGRMNLARSFKAWYSGAKQRRVASARDEPADNSLVANATGRSISARYRTLKGVAKVIVRRTRPARTASTFGFGLVLLALIMPAAVFAQTTSFTYQGRLTEGGTPANNTYDLQFALFDSLVGGNQIGATQTLSTVAVTGGVFTVQLDFGVNAFPGANRFLEIVVRPTSGGSFTTLSPRQQISSTPYAIRTLNAGAADALSSACVACVQDLQINQVAGSKVNGTIPAASVPDLGASYIKNTTALQNSAAFNISGNGTTGGTLSGNVVNATTQYNIGSNRVLSVSGVGIYVKTNTFVGIGAGASNTPDSIGDGSLNSFYGSNAGTSNTVGGGNSFFGVSAGSTNTTGGSNSFFGTDTGGNNTAGGTNSFFGAAAGRYNTIGSNNSFFGGYAAFNSTGDNNSFFGASTGQSNRTGSSNTLLGKRADVGSGDLTHSTAIGADATVSTSNTIMLGTSIDTVVAANRMRVTVIPPEPSVASVCFNPQGDLKQCGFSSLRFKQNVQPFRGGLDIVRRLRPITFDWKESGLPDIGLGAEEVAKVAPSFTFTDSKGEIAGVKYERLDLLLINAVKEQQQQIERQQKQIATLVTSNAALNARLRVVERALRRKAGSARRRR